MFGLKVTFGLLLASTIVVGFNPCSAAEKVDLPNGNFEEGLKNWRQRTNTESAYQVASPGFEGKNHARLILKGDEPARDREAIYFGRQDLPTQEGYYRLHFVVRSDLTKGHAGVLVAHFGDGDKVLSTSRPTFASIGGQTPWREVDFIYLVPPGTKMTSIQLEGSGIEGTVDYDNVSVEKLDNGTGKKLLSEQATRLIITPFVQMPERTTKLPLKAHRLIYTDEEIATARANIAKYPEAKAVLDRTVKAADPWLEWSDEDLRDLLTTGAVTRGFDLNVNGCPVHGKEVFNKGGAYPWKLDPRHPMKVTCPVGGEVYPSNDYETYYKSGFKTKIGWDTKYVDDGWGWVDPATGERYWFVAYANQWNWYKTIDPALQNLSRAYLLTGDKKYAHKAAVMLYRLAEIYPSMNHEDQSRYGTIMKAQGGLYKGKILNAIWETFVAEHFAAAYDAVWDSIDGDAELQKLYGKKGVDIRSFIEANLLEDAIDAYKSEKIMGNFGMHQSALLHLLLARDHPERQEYYREMVDEPGGDQHHTGLRYALYNRIWRDGIAFESPGYNQLWIDNFAVLARLLKKGGYNLFADPRLKSLFDGPLTLTTVGNITPALGDSGSVMAGMVGRDLDTYAVAYDAYKDPRYLDWLASGSLTGPGSFNSWDSLFRQPLPLTPALGDKRAVRPQPSRLLAGYGLGFLNNPSDTTSLSMTYGTHISHYHWDFLHFDLFANGQAMLPDLGYGDAMNSFVPSIFTWSLNTIAHNTVVIDAKKQDTNDEGTLHEFAVSPFARSIDASSPAYKAAETYRRHLVQVDIDDNRSYVVDVFRVKGGKQHDYSLHGPPGEVDTSGGEWSAPAKGTLAGPDVELEQIYDDPVLGAKDYKGGYDRYSGSGFQHLFNVQELKSGTSTVHFKHKLDPEAQLRIHLLPTQTQETFLADAYNLPRARNHIVKFMIARRKATGEAPLESTFCSVLETYSGAASIESTEAIALNGGSGQVVKVQRAGATDIIISDPAQTAKTIAQFKIETDARTAVVTLDAAGKPQRVFFSGGTYLRCNGESYKAAPLQGTVSAIDAAKKTMTVTLAGAANADAASLANRVAMISNAHHSTVHPIASAELKGNKLTLKTADDLLVGNARVRSAKGTEVNSANTLSFAATYNGTTLLTKDYAEVGQIANVNPEIDAINLIKEPAKPVAAGSDVWISNVGTGDRVEFPSLFFWSKPK